MTSLDDHITVRQAADRLDYTVQHVRRLLRQGELSGSKVGRDWLVLESSVEEFANRRANLNPPRKY